MPVVPTLRFAGHELDPASGELRGPRGVIRLQPQPARVLTLLLLAQGELVTRETLQAELWPDTHVEVDQGLNYCIRQVRAALGDSSEQPRFIETLPRRGYRFLAPLETPPTERGAPDAEPPARRRSWLPTAALAGLAALGAGLWLVAARPERPVELPLRLALFPLAHPGRPPVAEEVALTESLLVALTRLGNGRVEVVGPVSTGPLAAAGLPFRDVARRLGADLLVDGGLRPDGDLFLELLRTADGAHLWAHRRPVAELRGESDRLAAEILAVALLEGRGGGTAERGAGEPQGSAQSSAQSAGKEKRAQAAGSGAPSR